MRHHSGSHPSTLCEARSDVAGAEARDALRAPGGLRLELGGVVQGVGFRPWVTRLARRLGVTGRVWNEAAGVVVEAFGAPPALDALRARIAACDLPGAQVHRCRERPLAGPAPAAPFAIAESAVPGAGRAPGGGRIPLAPDLATCPDCFAETADPAARRHRYPFAACAACGPRLSAATGLPYDRARTTLAPFPPCAACEAEYRDPADRRFHAEAIACPACGPRLEALDAGGAPCAAGEGALALAIDALRRGAIVSVQGVGGFHLACDATRAASVARLRLRKRRERRPFAVLVRDLAAAEALAVLDDAERALLASPARPIVLVRPRPGGRKLAPEVAPGLDRIGLLLAYTPLHPLLLDGVGAPLVMTSGNRSGEPIAHRREEAAARLGEIADLHLVHDRAIAAPCDDSVALVAAGAAIWIRRSRGCVPRPVRLRRPVARPVLGCGAQMHVSVCLAVGDEAFASPHVGDLDSPEALDAFEAAVARLEQLAGVRAEVVAHDLHPRYASTLWAARRGTETRAVQHHHAHLAALLAERGEPGPALGLVWDGTGWGPDGSAWGGELLLGDARGFERLATLRPIALAGGERAIREPWRLALAVLEDAFDGEPPLDRLPLFAQLPPERVAAVRDLLRRGASCVAAHGAGRWFDAFGALCLGAPYASYAGEPALRWNAAAGGAWGPALPYAIVRREPRPWQVDLRPAVRAAVAALLAGCPPADLSARFHETLADAAAALVAAAAEAVPDSRTLPVALSGGCFQNPLLTARVGARLAAAGRRVLRHREVPPGDGGIALGQVAVADAAGGFETSDV